MFNSNYFVYICFTCIYLRYTDAIIDADVYVYVMKPCTCYTYRVSYATPRKEIEIIRDGMSGERLIVSLIP